MKHSNIVGFMKKGHENHDGTYICAEPWLGGGVCYPMDFLRSGLYCKTPGSGMLCGTR